MLLSILKVSGDSMHPTIKNGSIIVVSRIPYFLSKPKIKQIVVMRRNKELLVKRIKEIKEDRYFLTGDNNEESLDSRKIGWIEKKDIVGRLLFKL